MKLRGFRAPHVPFLKERRTRGLSSAMYWRFGEYRSRFGRCRDTKALTNIRRANKLPRAWTADSHDVIFESNSRGRYDLFKQGIDQRTPEIIVATPMTGMLPQLSPDGRFVPYDARPGKGTAMVLQTGVLQIDARAGQRREPAGNSRRWIIG